MTTKRKNPEPATEQPEAPAETVELTKDGRPVTIIDGRKAVVDTVGGKRRVSWLT